MAASPERAIDSSSPPSLSDPAAPPDVSGGVDGVRVVLWLFVVLAVSVVVAFAFFYKDTRPEDRGFIIPAVLRDLYLPVVATGLLVAIDARQRGRSGWWWYLLCSPVPGVNVALSAAWLLRWRRRPRRFLRWDL